MSASAAEPAPPRADAQPEVAQQQVAQSKVAQQQVTQQQVAQQEVAQPEDTRPAPPLLAGNSAFLATALLVGAGVAYTAGVPQHWLRGVLVAAGGFLLGAVLRLLLPDGRAGMLEIRSKGLDVVCLAAVSVLIVTVSVLLPR